MVEEVRPRKKRKTSPRRKVVYPQNSRGDALRRKWQEPEFRAKHTAMLRDYVKRGLCNRFGVPDGMRKAEAMEKWAEARESARITMEQLEQSGVFADADAYAKEAIQGALEVLRSPMSQTFKLQAARLVHDDRLDRGEEGAPALDPKRMQASYAEWGRRVVHFLDSTR